MALEMKEWVQTLTQKWGGQKSNNIYTQGRHALIIFEGAREWVCVCVV